MKKFCFPFWLSLLACVLLCEALPVQAKLPKKVLRSLRHQQTQGLVSPAEFARLARPSLSPSVVASTVQQSQRQSTLPSFRTGQHWKRLPWPPEQKINEMVQEEKNILAILSKIWQFQSMYGDHHLFELFVRSYYKQQFGSVTPHLERFFHHVTLLDSPTLEQRIIKRMRFLAVHTQTLLADIDPNPSKSSVRLRYLQDIDRITPENFNPKKLVLSIEKRMSPHPEKDFPVRHVSNQAVFSVRKKQFPVFAYNGPLEYIGHLYRFLITGGKKNMPITVIFDENERALALYNSNRSLWLRVTAHEYANPNNLHIHLNELRPVKAINQDGVEFTDAVNVNLSIPLATPSNLPKHGTQQYLFEKLLLHPVKDFQGNDHIHLQRRSIF